MSSLQERAAARREQLAQEHTFVLPLNGYEDLFAVRYRDLSYGEIWKISEKNDGDGEITGFADLIINGCVEFLEVTGDGEYQSLGHRWTTAGVAKSFGVELPEGSTAREAVFAVFNGTRGSNMLVMHANAYSAEIQRSLTGADEAVQGESEPSVEG